MARAIIFLLLIVAVAVSAAPNCDQNELYRSCGTSCQPTCLNQSPSVCTLACIPGCECVNGYVRNAEGKCVPTYAC